MTGGLGQRGQEKKKKKKDQWVIISAHYFLGDGTEVQPELSDVIWADCCNQLDVLGRHHCFRP